MEIMKLVTFGLVATLLINILVNSGGSSKPHAAVIRIVTVVVIMIFIATKLETMFTIVRDLASKMQMDNTYLKIILKVVGIAYLAEFGSKLCEDAGEKSIGSKIELAGKVMIFVTASPVILALMSLITDLI